MRPGRLLRLEAVAGVLPLLAALAALVWANSPAGSGYATVRDTAFGPTVLDLHLSIGQWAADGLLAVFFFTIGLELKQELVTGELSHPRRAMAPIAAAAGGVAVPAVIFTVVAAMTDSAALRGWAVPTATDIAFAVAVLAVAGRGLPPAVRTFLLTLAVVDDLIAIAIIAVVYADRLTIGYAIGALAVLAGYAAAVHNRVTAWWLLLPLAITAWVLVHASGIHATVAGVLLGLLVPARELAPRFEHYWVPWSNGVAVPVFAFFAAGVSFGGLSGLGVALRQPVTVAVIAALVIGKPLGVMAAARVATRFWGAQLHPALRWADVTVIGVLAGIGFTVSLLIGDLAYGRGPRGDFAKIGVLSASVIAAVVGAILLRRRARPAVSG